MWVCGGCVWLAVQDTHVGTTPPAICFCKTPGAKPQKNVNRETEKTFARQTVCTVTNLCLLNYR